MTFLLASATNSTSTINDVEPGLLGFLVVAGMGIILVFLLRSMNKHLRKVGPKPDDDAVLTPEDLLLMNGALRVADGGSSADEGSAENALPGKVVAGEVVARDATTPAADRKP
ncbi:MAG TPA: hypothetical protein VI365_18100 [Trebonia sp.]